MAVAVVLCACGSSSIDVPDGASTDASNSTDASKADAAVSDAQHSDAAVSDASTSPRVTKVVASVQRTCVLLDNGGVKCWGPNANGELGLGDTLERGATAGQMGDALPYVDLGTGRTAFTVMAGELHTCAVLDNSKAKCWGHNASGELGLGDTNARGDGPGQMGDALPTVELGTGRTATEVGGGQYGSCALLNAGAIKCWGINQYGQAGVGDSQRHGDGPGEMGDSLLSTDLGSGIATAMTVGFHTCALLNNGSVKCWGYGMHGQLGQGDKPFSRGNMPGQIGNALPAIDFGTGRTAKAIAAGTEHTCVLLDNAKVKCWGYNNAGQLGLGDMFSRGDEPNEMGDKLPYVDLGTGRTATAIFAGRDHACAVLDNGKLKCWGSNGYGALGLGDTASRGDESGEMGDALPAIELGTGRTASSVAMGTGHMCAVLDNGKLKCWGLNAIGQLGLGDKVQRGSKAGEMGDALPYVDLGTK